MDMYQNFNREFEEFLNLIQKKKYKFLARPNQSLETHLQNMVFEAGNYFERKMPISSAYRDYIYWSTFISILCHDFGKILPHFQFKIRKPLIWKQVPEIKKKLSYHTLIGAIFAKILCQQLKNQLPDLFSEDTTELKPTGKMNFNVFMFLVIEAIISHHSPSLLESYDDNYAIYDQTEMLELFGYIEQYRQNYVIEIYNSIFQSLFKNETLWSGKKIGEIWRKNLSLNSWQEFQQITEFFSVLFQKTIEEIGKIGAEKDIFGEIDIPDLFDIFRTIKNDLKNDTGKVFVLSEFIGSILCDLDIWDSRFYDPEKKKHRLPFFEDLDNIIPNDEDYIQNYINNKFQNITNTQDINPIIAEIRKSLFQKAKETPLKVNEIYSLAAPTGAGKTLTLLNCAQRLYFDIKQNNQISPTIYYVLPFISIGNQVNDEILSIYNINKKINNQDTLLCQDTYLTESCWEYSEHNKETKTISGPDAKWLISSWRSQIIITTFVKLFHTLLKPKKANYLRIHRLLGSIILLDEVQCMPIGYWGIIHDVLINLKEIFGCTIILSTATQPALFELNETKLIASEFLLQKIDTPIHQLPSFIPIPQNQILCNFLNRYSIHFFQKEIFISDFLDLLTIFISKYQNKDILIVVNTKKVAIILYQFLFNNPGILTKFDLYLLSTLVLPADRKANIDKIKNKIRERNNFLVISTQVIEAGVDLSFDVIIRDLAPLDSIVQVAGRCNRNFTSPPGIIHLVKLLDDENKTLFYNQVYKITASLNITQNILIKAALEEKEDEIFGKYYHITEPNLRAHFQEYFYRLKEHNDYERLLEKYSSLQFEQLSSEFEMIEQYANQVYILILNTDEAQKIHNFIQEELNHIPMRFYSYVITLSSSEAESLVSENILNICKKKNELLYYFLPKEKIHLVYGEKSGFIGNIKRVKKC